jgi:hypothetical protein
MSRKISTGLSGVIHPGFRFTVTAAEKKKWPKHTGVLVEMNKDELSQDKSDMICRRQKPAHISI